MPRATANIGSPFAPSIARDTSGPIIAAGPELRVIVDTLPPHLELAAWRAADGQIVVHWVAAIRC